MSWPHKFITWNRGMTHPDDEYHRLIGRCEQVVVDGYLLRQVLSPEQLAAGTFLADVTNQTLFVWDAGSRDLNKTHVEASVRQEILRVEGDHVQLRGLRFRYAANMAQHGAVALAGRHNVLQDCVVERNLIAGNREGFNFREQTRSTPTIEDRAGRPVWNHDQLIRHNLIVLNRDAQVWGWFDVKDNRHWPASNAPTNQTITAATAMLAGIADAYVEETDAAQSHGLTLEKLRLRFERNVYFAAAGQGWFKWGPTWARHKSYASLRDFQSELGLDADSQALDPAFSNTFQLDFRLIR